MYNIKQFVDFRIETKLNACMAHVPDMLMLSHVEEHENSDVTSVLTVVLLRQERPIVQFISKLNVKG